jgi:hypothetical protein
MNLGGHSKHAHKAGAAGADVICDQGGRCGRPYRRCSLQRAHPRMCRYMQEIHVSPMAWPASPCRPGCRRRRERSLAAALMSRHRGLSRPETPVRNGQGVGSIGALQRSLLSNPGSTLRSSRSSGNRTDRCRSLSKPAHLSTGSEQNRSAEIRSLTERGVVPLRHELNRLHAERGS